MSLINQVPTGPYFGFSLEELQAELIRYKNETKTSGTRIVGASINGQSFQFGNREGSLSEWSANLQAALSYLRPDLYDAPPSNSSAARLV
jgi:hypothetical protein